MKEKVVTVEPKTKLFCIMVTFFWMAMYTYQPQLSVYAGVLGAGATLTGTILSSYGFTQMLCRVPLGMLSDRLRKRKLFVILGAVITMLSAVGMYLAKTPAMLLVFRGMSGLSASAWVTYTVLYSSYFDSKDAPRAMANLGIFNNMGMLLGQLAGGLVAQWFDVKASFLLAVICGGVAVVLSLQATEKAPETVQQVSVKELLAVALDKRLLAVSFLALLSQIVHQGATMGFTPKFAAELGATSSQLGILAGAAMLGSLCASWCNSHALLNRFGARRMILFGQCLFAAATVALPVVSKNVAMVLFMQFLVGYGNGSYFPLMMGMAIADIDTAKRGVAMGLFQSIYALGMFIGPLATGILIEHMSLGNSISVIGCVGFVALLLGYFMVPRSKKN